MINGWKEIMLSYGGKLLGGRRRTPTDKASARLGEAGRAARKRGDGVP